MNALPLIDLALSRAPAFPRGGVNPAAIERLAAWAGRLTETALKELETLRAVDEDLGRGNEQSFDRQAAELIYGAYEGWSRQAEALIRRIERIEMRGGRAAGAAELRHECGRVMAMLRVTLDDTDEADEQFRQGRTYTIEEVRDELRPAVHAERAGRTAESRPVAPGGDAGRDRVAG